jgi:hypothetical protein
MPLKGYRFAVVDVPSRDAAVHVDHGDLIVRVWRGASAETVVTEISRLFVVAPRLPVAAQVTPRLAPVIGSVD